MREKRTIQKIINTRFNTYRAEIEVRREELRYIIRIYEYEPDEEIQIFGFKIHLGAGSEPIIERSFSISPQNNLKNILMKLIHDWETPIRDQLELEQWDGLVPDRLEPPERQENQAEQILPREATRDDDIKITHWLDQIKEEKKLLEDVADPSTVSGQRIAGRYNNV